MIRSRLRYALARLGEQLWVGPAVYTLLAVLAIALAVLSDRVPVPWHLPDITTETLRALLNVLATTLLGIATFAVASLVAAYASASTTATPRAFVLVVADNMSRRALSVFVAAWIFSIVGLVTVRVLSFGKTGHLVLFVMIIAVVAWLVLTFVAWVDSIARLGRMGDTIDKLDKATLAALRHWGPGGRMGAGAAPEPADAIPIFAAEVAGRGAAPEARIGHVQHIDLVPLQAWAGSARAQVWLRAVPGAFVPPHRPLAMVAFDPGTAPDLDAARAAMRRAVVIGIDRSFTQDPRFGLIALSEIASRALSPGINDPGTAIDVIRRLTRIFLIWGEIRGSTAVPDHDRVHLPALDPVDLMEDGFLGIERDGAGMVEVGVWLQTAYASLCLQPDAGIARAARDRASEARDRADRALDFPKDRERIAATAAAIPRLPG